MKRKLIDLDLETERRLSILASSNGMSLKKYIEYILFQHGNDHIIKTEERNVNTILEVKIKKARKEKDEGNLKTIDPNNVWKSI